MSTETGTGTSTAPAARSADPPFRYGAALADEIERRWQERWARIRGRKS